MVARRTRFFGYADFWGFLLGGIFGFWHADFADSGDSGDLFWFWCADFLGIWGIVWWGFVFGGHADFADFLGFFAYGFMLIDIALLYFLWCREL